MGSPHRSEFFVACDFVWTDPTDQTGKKNENLFLVICHHTSHSFTLNHQNNREFFAQEAINLGSVLVYQHQFDFRHEPTN